MMLKISRSWNRFLKSKAKHPQGCLPAGWIGIDEQPKSRRTEMKNQIEIKTALNDGIYKSDGGGETRTHHNWNVGPRNLMNAIEMLHDHSASMTRGYGNVGHGGSWIVICGVKMNADDIADYEHTTDRDRYGPDDYIQPISRTKWCRDFIESVLDGSLIQGRKDFQKISDEGQYAYHMGLKDGRENNPKSAAMSEGIYTGYEYDLGYSCGTETQEMK